ncbi:MAG: peptide-methionine (R)-S-oxide reductase MsrB [Myxococcota bacterium]|nr:peptide-methionine (R)-S-oxide reductase MsrB [Myxococcota bacterium]
MSDKVQKSDTEWKQELTPEQFAVARMCGTEPPFTGKYWNHHAEGTYHCVCCGTELFDSATKFESGSGWPSFFSAVEDALGNRVATRTDRTHGMTRVEILCGKCDAHLGHVFEDGPKPTGLRYCVNSASLEFHPRTAAPRTTEPRTGE